MNVKIILYYTSVICISEERGNDTLQEQAKQRPSKGNRGVEPRAIEIKDTIYYCWVKSLSHTGVIY